jgi:polyisoprenoid-binding protein YceI
MAASTAVQTGLPTWELDPAHSSVEFSVKHMMMTTVRGRFKSVQATLRGDRDHPNEAGVEVTIAAASVDTGVGDRDTHLRGSDFFDAEHFPRITFRSTKLENPPKQEGDRFRVIGELVIRDSSMEVVLDCQYPRSRHGPLGEDARRFRFPDGDRPSRVGAQVEPGAGIGREQGPSGR